MFILVINQLDAQNFCFILSSLYSSTCFEHHVLIIRRSKLYYTASGIITPVGGRPVHRTATYRCDDVLCSVSVALLCSVLPSPLLWSILFCSTLFFSFCSAELCCSFFSALLCSTSFALFYSALLCSFLLCSTLFPFFCSTLPFSVLLPLLCSTLFCSTLLCSVYSPHRQSRTINATFYLSIDYAARPRLRVQFHRLLSQTRSSSDFQSPVFHSLWVEEFKVSLISLCYVTDRNTMQLIISMTHTVQATIKYN